MNRLGWVAACASLCLVVGCSRGSEERTGAAEKPEPPTEVREIAKELEGAGVRVPGAEARTPAEGAAAALVVTGEFSAPLSSDVVARVPGRVEVILAEEGDLVRGGQPLLRLEGDYARLELERAEAEVARAKAALAEAESDFRRKQELLSRGSVPQAVHDRSEATDGQARAAAAAAEATAALARQRLADTEVRSPIAGVVAERRVDPGERLSEATVAYVVTQLEPLRLRFELPERYLAAVETGQPLQARVDAYPGQVFAGRVTRLSKVVNAQTRAFSVEAEFPNRDRRLRPGMFARIELPGLEIAAPSAAKSEPEPPPGAAGA